MAASRLEAWHRGFGTTSLGLQSCSFELVYRSSVGSYRYCRDYNSVLRRSAAGHRLVPGILFAVVDVLITYKSWTTLRHVGAPDNELYKWFAMAEYPGVLDGGRKMPRTCCASWELDHTPINTT